MNEHEPSLKSGMHKFSKKKMCRNWLKMLGARKVVRHVQY